MTQGENVNPYPRKQKRKEGKFPIKEKAKKRKERKFPIKEWEKAEKEKEFEILKATPSKSLWLKDLDELENRLDVGYIT